MILAKYKKLKMSQQEELSGFLFIIPYLIGFIIFQGLPFILAFIISLTDLRFISKLEEVEFVGLSNFFELFSDKRVIESIMSTFYFSAIYIPLIMVLSLLFALILNKDIFAKNSVRTMLFMPYVSNMVAIAVVWTAILDPIDGPINHIIRSFGVENPPMWLMDPKFALATVAVISVWKSMGLNLVTYLAALQNVPKEMMEAASIDGASRWQKLINITIPMISPTTFFLLITSIVTSLQNFTIIKVLTDGGPGTATNVLSMNIVQSAFASYRFGYASAQALVMFVIVMIVTIIQWRGQKKWVNYM